MPYKIAFCTSVTVLKVVLNYEISCANTCMTLFVILFNSKSLVFSDQCKLLSPKRRSTMPPLQSLQNASISHVLGNYSSVRQLESCIDYNVLVLLVNLNCQYVIEINAFSKYNTFSIPDK